ncbi:MAG: cyanophycin synthetase [Alphaproteobacteria bacterium]|nr:cyanophycin synthetase [Alphaproteobacteria bacterium]
MEIKAKIFTGPNIYSHQPVVVFSLARNELAGFAPAERIRAIHKALSGWFPDLEEWNHPPGAQLEETVAHTIARTAVAAQRSGGADVRFGEILIGADAAIIETLLGFEDATTAIEAGRLAASLMKMLAPDLDQTYPDIGDETRSRVNGAVESFLEKMRQRKPTISVKRLTEEAASRDIPWQYLGRNLVLYGQGRFQRRTFQCFSDRTALVAVQISSNKSLTNRLLGTCGIPVPAQRVVSESGQARTAAEEIGFPVVVKPLSSDFGTGVSVDLTDADQVDSAFKTAREQGPAVIVESFLKGEDHRLLIIDGEAVAAAKRSPACVTGDGHKSIRELVADTNLDPKRGWEGENLLTRLPLDREALDLLKAAGLAPNSVLPKNKTAYLRRNANLSTGGTATDVTDSVHPDNWKAAIDAASVIGLDIAGIDFLTPDISRSHHEVGGGICEVNCTPGLRMHLAPSVGKPRNVVANILDSMFPGNSNGRVPVAAITGTNGKTTTAHMLAHILKSTGRTVGLTTTEGIYINDRRIEQGDCAGPRAARQVLSHPQVEEAVLESARGAIVRFGLGFDCCDVGAVLNVDDDHIGFDGIDSVERMAEVKRLVVEVARDTAVLNADDPLCVAMSGHTQAEKICYVAMNAENPVVRDHVGAGRPAVTLESAEEKEKETITIHRDGKAVPVIEAGSIPAALNGHARHNVQNALFATALAWAMGRQADAIGKSLGSFENNFENTPGRMNFFDGLPFTVILDFAHNPTKLEAICRTVDQFPVAGRRLCVLSSPGNRRDDHIREMGRRAAGHFDRFICTNWDDLRGRGAEEVPALIGEGLTSAGVDAGHIRTHLAEKDAVAAGLGMAKKGDILLISGKDHARGWNQITSFDSASDRPQN